MEILTTTENEALHKLFEEKLNAALGGVSETKREFFIGSIIDRLLEEKHVEEYSEILAKQAKEKAEEYALLSGQLLKEKLMELGVINGLYAANNKLKLKEEMNRLDLEYIEKKYNAEIMVLEDCAARHIA